jgi:hypothetical protein
MKNTTLYVTLFFAFITINAFSQARKELNFGLVGVNYEIPVHKDITLAPGAATNFDLDWLSVHLKANYYFDNLFGISDAAWDVYGGAGAGYAFYNGDDNGKGDDLDLGLHAGARWFWNDKWGVYAEFGSGSTTGAMGGLVLTVKL